MYWEERRGARRGLGREEDRGEEEVVGKSVRGRER